MRETTPAPWKWHWRFEDGVATGSVFAEPRRGQAWAVAMCPRYETQERWEANARLIAAAPDLYEVCRRTVDEFRAQQDDADAALAQHIAEHPVSLVSLAFAALQRCSPQDTQS